MDYFEKLQAIIKGLNKRFPKGNEPFQIITRLCEESGELAKEVNHFEATGVKIKNYGKPDKDKLAKEVQDVIRCALQVASYYGIEKELHKSIDESIEKLKKQGYIEK